MLVSLSEREEGKRTKKEESQAMITWGATTTQLSQLPMRLDFAGVGRWAADANIS